MEKKKMHALGVQVILELESCNKDVLNDAKGIEQLMVDAAVKSGATVVSSNFNQFNPHGVSGVVIIAESHFTIHTWPEYGYAAIDIFTCGDLIDFSVAAEFLRVGFESKKSSVKKLKRGILFGGKIKLPHKPAAI